MLRRALPTTGSKLPAQARAASIASYFYKDVHYPFPPPKPSSTNPPAYPSSASPSLEARKANTSSSSSSSSAADPRIIPTADGRTFFNGTDALSAYNTAATPLPIWSKGTEYSNRFENLSGTGEGGKVPSLCNIEHSWGIWDGDMRERVRLHLDDLSGGDWKKMTIHEKKAAWYVQFGPWGTRAPAIKHGDGHWYFYRAVWAVGISVVLYNLYGASKKRDKTTTTEYQRKLNHKYRAEGYEAVPGLLDENYGGKGVIVGHGTPYSNEARVF